MKFRFILGAARSGTTFLARLMALSSSSTKLVLEPLPKVHDLRPNGQRERWCVLPDSPTAAWDRMRAVIDRLTGDDERIDPDLYPHAVSGDPAAEFLLVKEIHSLFALQQMLEDRDHRTLVITRDLLRILDSYFHVYTRKQRTYLVDEFRFLRRYLRGGNPSAPYPYLDGGLETAGPRVRGMLQRPEWLASEPMRIAAVNSVVQGFLDAWAAADERLHLLSFEDLCADPAGTCPALFDFLGLAWDEQVLEAVRAMSTGKESGSFDTRKDSSAVLVQPYRALEERVRNRIKRLVSG